MFIKLLLNVIVNIAIFTLLLSLFWTFNHEYYTLMAGTIVTLSMFIYFKIRIIKSVRELTKKR